MMCGSERFATTKTELGECGGDFEAPAYKEPNEVNGNRTCPDTR